MRYSRSRVAWNYEVGNKLISQMVAFINWWRDGLFSLATSWGQPPIHFSSFRENNLNRKIEMSFPIVSYTNKTYEEQLYRN